MVASTKWMKSMMVVHGQADIGKDKLHVSLNYDVVKGELIVIRFTRVQVSCHNLEEDERGKGGKLHPYYFYQL